MAAIGTLIFVSQKLLVQSVDIEKTITPTYYFTPTDMALLIIEPGTVTLPNDKILGLSKLKAFADSNLNGTQNL